MKSTEKIQSLLDELRSDCSEAGELLFEECIQCVKGALKEIQNLLDKKEPEGVKTMKCKGTNCSAEVSDIHSIECRAEHDAAVYSGAGNRNPHARYRGYKDEPLWPNASADEKAAWIEGENAKASVGRKAPTSASYGREEFSNATMRVPCPGKPHIAAIRGYWRVSPLPKPYSHANDQLWRNAYIFITKKNAKEQKK